MAAYEADPRLERPALVASGPHTGIRQGHEPFAGRAGTWTLDDLRGLQGRWIACPGCTIDDYHSGHCHTKDIVDAFRTHYPDLDQPAFVSGNTKTVLGKGGLHDVYVRRNAVFCGCFPPRASPHLSQLGFKFKESVFGNPAKRRKLKRDKEVHVSFSVRASRFKRKRADAPVLVSLRVGRR